MHPGAGNYDKTIVNALMHYDKNSLSNIGDELRPGIVHRIDKNTSGLVVIAKNNETHENLSKQFSDHTIIREYQLLIWGKLRPSSGRIETFITRSSKNRQLMEVSSSKGKKAITNYKTLEIFQNQKKKFMNLESRKLLFLMILVVILFPQNLMNQQRFQILSMNIEILKKAFIQAYL